MGFCFKKKESVAKAIPRLGCERVRRAQECLENCSRPEAIHGARKEIKKATAVLRLARENISKKQFRTIRKRLGKAADCLSKPRDAAVRSTTLRNVSRRFKQDLPPGAFRKLRVQLRRDADEAMEKLVEKRKAESAMQYLGKAEKAFRNLRLDDESWDAIAPGLRKAYRQCHAAYAHAVAVGSAEEFHEWRKRAKDLRYQLMLLQQISPEMVDRMACELETVGEYLGEDHDLFVLQQCVEELQGQSNDDDRHEVELLRKIINNRQRELREQAIATGKYFYAEKPGEFCRRLGDYWRAWERDSKSDAPPRKRKGRA